MFGGVSGGGGGGDKRNVGGAFSKAHGKGEKATAQRSSKELGKVESTVKEKAGPAAKEKGAGATLEERGGSLGELEGGSRGTRGVSLDSTGSGDSFGSHLEEGEARVFRFLGKDDETTAEAGLTKAKIQNFADADAIEAEMLAKTDGERRKAGYEHMVDSSGSPLMSFVLDPVALFTKSGDGKLLGLLSNCRYLAVGHAKAEQTLVPMKAQLNQRRETEVLVFPKEGTVQGKVDFYENPFFGVKTPEEAQTRWEAFKAGRKDGSIQPIEPRDRERAESGFHTTGDAALRQKEFDETYPGGKGPT